MMALLSSAGNPLFPALPRISASDRAALQFASTKLLCGDSLACMWSWHPNPRRGRSRVVSLDGLEWMSMAEPCGLQSGGA